MSATDTSQLELPRQTALVLRDIARAARDFARRSIVAYPGHSGMPSYFYALRASTIRLNADILASGGREFLFGLVRRGDPDRVVSRLYLELGLVPSLVPVPRRDFAIDMELPADVAARGAAVEFGLGGLGQLAARAGARGSWPRARWSLARSGAAPEPVDAARPPLLVLLALFARLGQLGQEGSGVIVPWPDGTRTMGAGVLGLPRALVDAMAAAQPTLDEFRWTTGLLAPVPADGLTLASAAARAELALNERNEPVGADDDDDSERFISIALAVGMRIQRDAARATVRIGVPDFITSGPLLAAFAQAVRAQAVELAVRLERSLRDPPPVADIAAILRRDGQLRLVARYQRRKQEDLDLFLLHVPTAGASPRGDAAGRMLLFSAPASLAGADGAITATLAARGARCLFLGEADRDATIDLSSGDIRDALWDRLGRTAHVLRDWLGAGGPA